MSDFAVRGDVKTAPAAQPANKAAAEEHSWLSLLGGHAAAAPTSPDMTAAKGATSSLAASATNSIFSHWADGIRNWWNSDSKDKPADKPAEPAPVPVDPQKAEANAKRAKEERDFNNRGTQRQKYEPDTRKEVKGEGTPPAETEDEVKRRVAGKMIGDEYIADAKDRVPRDPKAAVGDLTSKDGKLAFLKGFTQQDSTDGGKEENQSYCGPTAIIAASIYMKGPQGVTPLIDRMQHESLDTFKGDKKKIAAFTASMKEIQERANKGELTNGDMDVLKEQLYNSMHRQQEKNAKINKDDRQAPGINERTMKDYLDTSGLNKEMTDKNLDLRNIDNDGDGTRNHYVLRIGDDQGLGSVYDPFSRKDGQLVTARDEVGDYDNTQYATLHREARP